MILDQIFGMCGVRMKRWFVVMSDNQIWLQQCLNLQTAMMIYHSNSLGCVTGIVDGRETWFDLRFIKFVQLMNYVVFDEVWKVS